ncbi:unnamed protein product [marine sediment metagenome]|uniref:Protein NO VEIN C-terminal domain-containing protein n=1 Tax=marine sediment metagenome TaxID=412755 RepID=X0SJE8_9ZZZZ
MNEVRQILKAIEQYAEAYNRLEDMQKKTMSGQLPIGDQKTGVIGEFYTKIYLESIHPDAKIAYGNPSQRGWDLEIEAGPKCIRVQVKTVSEYSNARRISPIHSDWDQLFLVYLDKKFLPVALWEIADTSIVPRRGVLKNRTMPKPGDPKSGSVAFANRKDRLAELLQAIQRIKGEL